MVGHNEFRDALARLGAAVNVITTEGAAGRYGVTASAVCSVSDDPPTVLVCINRASSANPILKINAVLGINVLGSRHVNLSRRFASRHLDMLGRFSEGQWTSLTTGCPLLIDASVALDCTITSVNEVGTHSVLFCAVQAVQMANRVDGLIYFNRAYHPIGEVFAE